MNLQNEIKNYLQNTGQTVYSVLKKNGFISQTLLNRYLKGENNISVSNIEKLMEILGIKLQLPDGATENNFHAAINAVLEQQTKSKYSVAKESGVYLCSLSNFLKKGKGLETHNIEKVCTTLGITLQLPPIVVQEKPEQAKSGFMIGNQLRSVITQKGLTIYKVLKALKFNKGNVYNFVNIGRGMSTAKLQQIMDYVGCSIFDDLGKNYGTDIRSAIIKKIKSQNLKKTALCKELGVSTTLNLFLNGNTNISALTLDKIFTYLNLKIC
jgi:transcriptional regulator with XRE-family HTH domain